MGASSPRKKETSGWGGIRTPGTLRYSGFQDRRNRPLCHPSDRSCIYTRAFYPGLALAASPEAFKSLKGVYAEVAS
jgi:hypothetical protein